jgi:hypothetical protein
MVIRSGGEPRDEGQGLARPIGWYLKEADNRLNAAFDRALDEMPVDRRAWQVLSSLARRTCSEADLVAALEAFDQSDVVYGVVSDLRLRGWVDDGVDGLCLTKEGARQHAAIAPRIDRVRQQVSDALPREDYLTLIQLLKRLTDAL